jgi:diacylglycerol kinase (ATP)
MKSILIIINPKSGIKKSLKVFEDNQNKINQKNFIANILITDGPGHAERFVQKEDLSKYDRLIIMGGDGTINEVLSGLYLSKKLESTNIGIIPTGSGNSVMHDLNLLEIDKAFDAALGSNIIKIDSMLTQFDSCTKISISILGWGMFSYGNVLAEKLRCIGTIRYDVASIITLLIKKSYQAKLTIDDKKENEISCSFLVGCNSKHTGKGMYIAPNGGFKDRAIDFVTVDNKVSRFQIANLFSKVYSGKHIELPYVQMEKVNSFKINSNQETFFNIDGELVKSKSVYAKVFPNSVNIYV